MVNTPFSAMLLVLAASVLGALGPFLFKQGANSSTGGPVSFILNPWVLGGMLAYLTVMVLFTAAFKQGGTVRVLYPIYATTFIWAALVSWGVFGESLGLVHVAGMFLLMAGIVCMSW